MDERTKDLLIGWAEKYNDEQYFHEDPIAFPRQFHKNYRMGLCNKMDLEISAIIAAHLAWGRRSMIVRDCTRAFDEMGWKPYDYVMNGVYRNDDTSLHRTVKWSEFAMICTRLRDIYHQHGKFESHSLENFTDEDFRVKVFGQKPDRRAPNKKINMMRRWLVRDDGKVDIGLWTNTDKKSLIIPLDVHVYDEAVALGLTSRHQKDITTAKEITDAFREIFPDDPCLGDFALFGYGVSKNTSEEEEI